ncbi:MAG TPA: EAL domain-containing protein [Tepidisphaeraceae bacterium]|jgi:diguanylate cyclase (GGDEF)-like protein/PAS domain S-box-containing protein
MAFAFTENGRILIVDDNRSVHTDFKKILVPETGGSLIDAAADELFGSTTTSALAIESFELSFAAQGQEALELVRAALAAATPFAMMFVDMRMPPGWDGVETIARIWAIDPEIQVVLSTAYSDYSWEQITAKLGRTDRLLILKKPFDPVEVRQLANALTQKWALSRQANLKLGEMQGMVNEQTQRLQAEVDERRRSEAALQQIEERYALAVSGANDGIWDWDIKSDRIYFSTRWKALLGYGESDIGSEPNEWFSRVHADDVVSFRSGIDAHLQGKTDHLHAEHRMLHKDGTYHWMLCRGVVVRDAVGTAYRAAGSLSNISGQKAAEDELRRAARIDKLTGLPNRALVLDRLQNAIERHRRVKETHYAVLFLDFDRFKMVNDCLGHEAGDRLLVEIARRLESTVRTVDSVSHEAHTCTASRLGGDEFVVLLDGLRAAADAKLVADRILTALCVPYSLGEHEIISTASIGIVTSEYGHEWAEDVLRDADTAMYEAKAAGKGRAVLFDEAMRTRVERKLELENGLRRALEARQFVLHYQPIMSLITGRVEGFEALVRWNHPQYGVISPGEFIPVAEETGLIIPIGAWVFREALRQLAQWWTTFGRDAVPSISVNVSRAQLTLHGLPELLSKIARDEDVDPSAIHIEVTESAIMADTRHAVEILTRIKAEGFKIDMDDFGTGYSSLSSLHQFPIDVLKIDRSFIVDLDRGRELAAFVNAICLLARNLDITVIAEGVETPEQITMLQSLDCQAAQGYAFARPMPAEKVPEFLASLTAKVAA